MSLDTSPSRNHQERQVLVEDRDYDDMPDLDDAVSAMPPFSAVD